MNLSNVFSITRFAKMIDSASGNINGFNLITHAGTRNVQGPGSYERLMQLARGCYRPATTQVDEKKRQSERAKAKAGYAAQPRPTCEKSPGVGNLQSLCNRQSAKDAVQSQRLRKPQYESRSSTEERTGIQRQRSARLSYRDLDIVIAPCTNSHLNGSG